MAIFRRTKKRKETTTPLRTQSEQSFDPQPVYSALDATQYQPNWTYVEQKPSTIHGNASPQSQGWLVAPVPSQYQPLFVGNDHVHSLSHGPQKTGTISKLNLSSVTNLLSGDVPKDCPAARFIQNGVSPLYLQGTQYLNQGAALCDLISTKFDTIITQIDGERFSGDERELRFFPPPQPIWQQKQQESGYTNRPLNGKSKGMVNNSVSSALTSTNYFAKVNLYANSRLPPNLPPLRL
jgi:hypothetical protein